MTEIPSSLDLSFILMSMLYNRSKENSAISPQHGYSLCAGEMGGFGSQYRINVLFRGQVHKRAMATMLLFLVTIGLTLVFLVQASYINHVECVITNMVRSLED